MITLSSYLHVIRGLVIINFCALLQESLFTRYKRRRRFRFRRLYDCLVSLMEEKGAEWSDIRGVLERGMRNGAISLMKDVSWGLCGSIDI